MIDQQFHDVRRIFVDDLANSSSHHEDQPECFDRENVYDERWPVDFEAVPAIVGPMCRIRPSAQILGTYRRSAVQEVIGGLIDERHLFCRTSGVGVESTRRPTPRRCDIDVIEI